MTIEEAGGREILAAARRGLSPTASDAARVRRLAEATLAGGGLSVGDAPSVAVRAGSWLRRFVALGAVAAVAGGLGYKIGRRAERAELSSKKVATIVEASPVEASPVEASPALAPPPSLPMPVPAPPPAQQLPAARLAKEAVRRPTSAGPAAADSMAEEVRALRSVERALREHQPGYALALLRELDRVVPKGLLTEERQAVRTIARCASGDVPFGVNLAEDFAAHYPGSVYDHRVAESCAATDSDSSGDQAKRRESR